MDCLSEDVVYEILLRMSLTSICRFKRVCRIWYDLIKSNGFREEYYARQSNSALILPQYYRLFPDSGFPRLFYQFSSTIRCYRWEILSGETLTVHENLDITVPIPPDWRRYYYMTSPCRGVFLLYCIETVSYHNLSIDCHDLRLWNPATGAVLRLPPATRAVLKLPPAPPRSEEEEDYVYGLGWDQSTGSYKVVCLLYSLSKVALVHTPGSDTWRLVDSPVPEIHPLTVLRWCLPTYAHANGFCYWQTVSSYTRNFNCDHKIVSFDVAREVFATLPLPPYDIVLRAGFRGSSLSTYRDSLAWLALGAEHLQVWVLEQQQQQPLWTKVFDITIVRLYPSIGQVGIWNDTHLFLTIIEDESRKKILLYDMNTHHMEERNTDDRIDITFLDYKSKLFLD